MEPGKPALLGGSPVFEEFIPITRPLLPSHEELRDDFNRILQSNVVTKGSYLEAFESRLADFLGVKHVVGVSSCTLGLLLVYQSAGFGSGDVVVPSFTFMATVHPLPYVGATPVFADIDRATFCVAPESVVEVLSSSTVGIVAVHNFGNPADIHGLEKIAADRGIPLVFDAAHGFGALFEGRPVGSNGLAEVFSLSPTKLLIAGEGGIVATDDDSVAKHVRLGREYGNPGDYDSLFAGLNARMSEFHAAVGLRSLEMLESAAVARNEWAENLRSRLGELPGISFQSIRSGDRCSYKDFSVVINEAEFGLDRDLLARALRAENIDSRRYHDPPVHTHTAYPDGGSMNLTTTSYTSSRIISLPVWSKTDDRILDGICLAIERCHQFADALGDSAPSHFGT